MNRRRRVTIALLGLLTAAIWLCSTLAGPRILARLDPIGHPQIPPAALQGTETRSAAIVCSDDMGGRSKVMPDRTVVTVLEVALPGGRSERRVVLNRADYPPVYLGPLTRQLGSAPVETLLIDFGSTRAIVGYAGTQIPEYTSGTFRTLSGIQHIVGGCNTDYLWGGYGSYDGFVAVIDRDTSDFDRLVQVELRSSFTGHTANTNYDPPFDTSTLWLRVP